MTFKKKEYNEMDSVHLGEKNGEIDTKTVSLVTKGSKWPPPR